MALHNKGHFFTHSQCPWDPFKLCVSTARCLLFFKLSNISWDGRTSVCLSIRPLRDVWGCYKSSCFENYLPRFTQASFCVVPEQSKCPGQQLLGYVLQ